MTNVADTFNRAPVSNNWGISTGGNPWTVTPALVTRFSTDGASGLVSMNVVNTRHFTTTPADPDVVVTVDFSIPVAPATASIACSAVARYQDDNNMYLVQVAHDTTGLLDIQMLKRVAGTFISLGNALNVIPFTPNVLNTLEFTLSGRNLSCKVWPTGTAKPAMTLLSADDNTFTSGQAGTHSNLLPGNTNTLPVVVKYDNFTAAPIILNSTARYVGPALDAPHLGVRIYNNWGKAFDTWVTRRLEDFEFRHVIPGGCANAEIVLHNDDRVDDFNELAQTYNRVQIVDTRSLNILWEGRIESPRRNRENNTWELGCVGSMAWATDHQRPTFYIDNRINNFHVKIGGIFDRFNPTVNEDAEELRFTTVGNSWSISSGHLRPMAIWQGAEACRVFIGRFDMTYSGNATDADWRTGIDLQSAFSNADLQNVDLRAWNAADIRLTNKIGTDFAMLNAARLIVAIDIGPGSGDASDDTYGAIRLPSIQVQRFSATGAKLQTAASYPNAYLTVNDVVEDVVGRYMINGWDTEANNNPYFGQVGGEDIFIDTSGSTAQITRLTYYDGATAADILGDMMLAQPEAYWALWPSRYKAKGARDPNLWGRFRFAWEKWPKGVGYEARGIDRLDEQPDGSSQFNFLHMTYPSDTDPNNIQMQRFWDTNTENQAFTDSRIVRSITVKAEEPLNTGSALTKAKGIFDLGQRKRNAGTVTIRRPIFYYDDGANSYSGASMMVEPYEIRPGKLLKLTDMQPLAKINAFGYGSNPVPSEHDGAIFRVVATTYRTADNSCVCELDMPERFNTATQVLKSGIKTDNFVVKG